MKSPTLILSLVLMIFMISSANAKDNVKIATIGAIPHNLDVNQSPQKIVEDVIQFWSKQLDQVLPDQPDLIVLPEACDRPRGLGPEQVIEYYLVRKEQVLNYFRSVASENKCYVAFGTKHQLKNGSWRNSCFLLDREGNTAGVYNKNFPTIGEMKADIKAGNDSPVFQCDFGRVACAICFDLNFEELLQSYVAQKPDIIVFPSMYHGGIVQSYWAYSCRAFLVGAMGFREIPSEIRNPFGQVVASSTNYFNYTVAKVNLDYCMVHLDNNWAKLKMLKEKYGEDVTIHDPGKIGAVMVASELDRISAKEMIEEFEITLLDEYLDDSREFRLGAGNKE